MVSKYKKLYQVSTDTISKTCREWIGFEYKGNGTFTINYTLCGDTVPSVYTFEDLPGNGGDIAYYTLLIDFYEYPCVVEDSVILITGNEDTFSPVYGEDC